VKRSDEKRWTDPILNCALRKASINNKKLENFFYTYLLLPDLCSSSFDSGNKHQHLADPGTKVHMQFEGTRP
jgi:hypothetical protein